MNADRPDLTRLRELLADDLTGGLAPEDRAELDRLGQELGPAEAEAFAEAAAALDLCLGPTEFEPLPAALADRIRADAGKSVRPVAPARPVVLPLRRSQEGLAWAVAAACLLLALAATMYRPASPTPPSLADQRAALLRDAPDAITVAWAAPDKGDPTGKEAAGDLVWSTREQRGYMRFHGLKRNDPTKDQYQLWIFDADQDDRYPVDGGVFDVPAAAGDVIVPVTAKIHVGKPTLFAVTVEKPGGVVVSKRDRLTLAAPVPKT